MCNKDTQQRYREDHPAGDQEVVGGKKARKKVQDRTDDDTKIQVSREPLADPLNYTDFYMEFVHDMFSACGESKHIII